MFRQSTGVTDMKFMEYRMKCLILIACIVWVSVGWATEAEEDSVLAKLQVSAQALTTYECRLEYLY